MYTAQHPDVHKKEQEIRTQESFIQGMMSAETTAPSNQERPAENAPDAEDDIGILQLKKPATSKLVRHRSPHQKRT